MASEKEEAGLRQKLIVPEAPSPLFSSLFGAPARLQASPPPPPSACAPAAPERTLGALGLALFCFASIAGGPYGIENSVGAIGALPTMLALVGTALAWSLTQALMAAELSSMFPSNSGYILWVLKGLGPTAGFVNAWLGFCMGVLNLPMYTGLAASAVDQVLPLSEAQALGLQVGLLALGVAVNIAGLGAVEKFTGLLVVVVQVPFVLMPIAWAAQRRGFEWQALGRSREDWGAQLGPALAIVCWNSLGWNSLGNVAGEVKNPTRNIPLGFCLAVCAIALNYLVPLVTTLAMAPDTDQWQQTAYFVGIAAGTAPWLGALAAMCGVLSCTNNLIPQLTMASRATKATVRAGMFPRGLEFLGRDSTLTGTPVAAIVLNAAAALCLLRLDFGVLAVLEVLCAMLGLLLQFGAFLVLKHQQPHAHRPFAVPGGLLGAYAITLPFFALAALLVYLDCADNLYAVTVFAAALFFALIGRFWYASDVYSEAVLVVLQSEGAPGVGEGGGAQAGAAASLAAQQAAALATPLPLETSLLLRSSSGAC